MTPVYQTKDDRPDGNCFAACVATILDRPLEQVDVNVAECRSMGELIAKVEQKANIKFNRYPNTVESLKELAKDRFCIVSVCAFLFNGDPDHPQSVKHAVVCEISDDGKLAIVCNPDRHDQRKRSPDQFPAVASEVLIIKPMEPAH